MHNQPTIDVRVAQHVFGHLRREDSAEGREGFQTARYTRDTLTQADIVFLEGVAQYQGPPDGPAKWQCFQLPSGHHAITRIVPLRDPDSLGRSGRYLAHALILNPVDWLNIGSAPFMLIQPSYYVADIGELGPTNPSDIFALPSKVLTLQSKWEKLVMPKMCFWEPKEIVALLMLVHNSTVLRKKRASIIITGSEAAILTILAMVYVLAAPDERAALSFDTAAQGCDWNGMPQPWALGSVSETAREFSLIDADQRRVLRLPDLPVEDDPFLHWAKGILTRDGIYRFCEDRSLVHHLAAVLAGSAQTHPALDSTATAFVEFANTNSSAIDAAIQARSISGLSEDTQFALCAETGDTPAKRLAWLAQADEGQITAAIYQVLLKRVVSVDDVEVILAQSPRSCPELVALAAYLADSPQNLATALASIEEAAYARLLIDLNPHIHLQDTAKILNPRHANLWLAWVVQKLTTTDQIALAWLLATVLDGPRRTEDLQELWATNVSVSSENSALIRACWQVLEPLGLSEETVKPTIWNRFVRGRREQGNS